MTISDETINISVRRWLSEWQAGVRPSCGAAVDPVKTDIHIDQLLPQLVSAAPATILRATIMAFQAAAESSISIDQELTVLLSVTLQQSDHAVMAPFEIRLAQEIDLFCPPEIVVGYSGAAQGHAIDWLLEEYRCPLSNRVFSEGRHPPGLYRCYRSALDVAAGATAFERCVEFGGIPPKRWADRGDEPVLFGLVVLGLV